VIAWTHLRERGLTMNKARIASIAAALAVLLAAGAKVLSGDITNVSATEVFLALSTIAAAFGFQRS
jgi:hypothetical protein